MTVMRPMPPSNIDVKISGKTPPWLWVLWAVCIGVQAWLITDINHRRDRAKSLVASLEEQQRLTSEGLCLGAALLSMTTITNRRQEAAAGGSQHAVDSVVAIADTMIRSMCKGVGR